MPLLLPPHDGEVNDRDEAYAWFDKLFKKFDLKKELKRLVYGGFDSWDDYKKYGDAFVEVTEPPESGTR